jgi:hypothetical protein
VARIEFCSHYLSKDSAGWTMFPKVGRLLAKAGVSLRAVEVRKPRTRVQPPSHWLGPVPLVHLCAPTSTECYNSLRVSGTLGCQMSRGR